MRTTVVVLAAVITAAALASVAPRATAQAGGIESKLLLRSSVSGDNSKESILVSSRLAPRLGFTLILATNTPPSFKARSSFGWRGRSRGESRLARLITILKA